MITGDALPHLHFSISLGHVGFGLFPFRVSLLVPNMTVIAGEFFHVWGEVKKCNSFEIVFFCAVIWGNWIEWNAVIIPCTECHGLE